MDYGLLKGIILEFYVFQKSDLASFPKLTALNQILFSPFESWIDRISGSKRGKNIKGKFCCVFKSNDHIEAQRVDPSAEIHGTIHVV